MSTVLCTSGYACSITGLGSLVKILALLAGQYVAKRHAIPFINAIWLGDEGPIRTNAFPFTFIFGKNAWIGTMCKVDGVLQTQVACAK